MENLLKSPNLLQLSIRQARRFALTGLFMALLTAFQLASAVVYAECSFRSFSSSEDDVIGAYIAYYGRPADPGGLLYWVDRLEAEGSLDSIIQAFGESQEFDQRFGSLDNAALVTNLYDQLFGRNPDIGGLNFYVDEINAARMTLQSAALNILFGMQNDDITIVINRMNVVKYYISQLEARNAANLEPSAETLASLIASVTVDTETAATACASIDTLIDESLQPGTSTYSGDDISFSVVGGEVKDIELTYINPINGRFCSYTQTITTTIFSIEINDNKFTDIRSDHDLQGEFIGADQAIVEFSWSGEEDYCNTTFSGIKTFYATKQ